MLPADSIQLAVRAITAQRLRSFLTLLGIAVGIAAVILLTSIGEGIHRFVLAGNATWSTNRIRQFTDSSRGTPVVRRNVEPMLTPRFISAHRIEFLPAARWSFSLEGRYQSRAFLDNTSSPDRVLPDYYMLDASANVPVGRLLLTVRGQNLGDTRKFGSGAVSSSGRVRYFVLPARALFVTATIPL